MTFNLSNSNGLRQAILVLIAYASSEGSGEVLNGWACAVKICHDGMLEDTNSLDGALIMLLCENEKSPY